jgi:threonine dehydrogenase-like Zn-dependent dehydrogenase
MGHETVGHVAKVGGNVIDLVEGTCVTVNPVLSCDDCDVCRAGNEQSCPQRKVIGVPPELTSAFAEYLLVRRSNMIALAEGIDPELGALVERLAVGYHAAVRGACSSDDAVLVIGGGPIGQAAFLAARRLGATRVAVSDLNPTRRALCAELGAAVIDPSAKPLEESIVDALGAKATLVIDAVGASATLADALKASPTAIRTRAVCGHGRILVPGLAGRSLRGAARPRIGFNEVMEIARTGRAGGSGPVHRSAGSRTARRLTRPSLRRSHQFSRPMRPSGSPTMTASARPGTSKPY